MIALALMASTVQVAAPPITVPRPATTWSCNFTAADAGTFMLKGTFAEAPIGTDPNRPLQTSIDGSGSSLFTGAKPYQAFESSDHYRAYMVHFRHGDGSNFTVLFSLHPGGELSIATITRYVPDPKTGRGTLSAFATGYCEATFHPIGYKATGQ